MIRLEELEKHYRMGGETVRALAGVDLVVERGEAVAIVGPSGSGKSTLLHLLGALDTPTSGRVLVDGRDLAELDEASRDRYRNEEVGFVFQSFHLQPHLTARENVELPLKIAGVARSERAGRAEARLERVGLADRVDHLPTELSGGERQRVSIARALASDPHLLLADEPTGNLDSETGRAILDLFREVHAGGEITLVLVTHDEPLARGMERTVDLRDGRVADGSPADGAA